MRNHGPPQAGERTTLHMSRFHSLLRFSQELKSAAFVAACLCFAPSLAFALDIGVFRIVSTPQQPPVGVVELRDDVHIDPASVRARVATPEAYQVAGLRYHPGLAAVRISARAAGAQGGVALLVENLPADAKALDLLVTVNDRLSLSMAEYRVDFRNGPREVAPSPAGTYLATRDLQNAAPTQPAAGGSDAAATLANGEQITAIRAALGAWANAWSARDLDRYVAAYAPDFAGQTPGDSRDEWLEQRRSRIAGRRSISVDISNLKIEQEGAAMVARFTQRYKSDKHTDTTQKRIDFAPVGGRWLIVHEATVR